MKEPTPWQKVMWELENFSVKDFLRQAVCKHKLEIDMREAVADNWGRCSSFERCKKCRKGVSVTVYLFEKP